MGLKVYMPAPEKKKGAWWRIILLWCISSFILGSAYDLGVWLHTGHWPW